MTTRSRSSSRRYTRWSLSGTPNTPTLWRSRPFPASDSLSGPQFRNFKIIYRRYAGLYFCICVDVNDNNLAYLEAIHNFVEVLNEYFHNVCELDLVFNFYKVYTVVDEMFLAGEIRETSQTKVLKQLLMLQSLE
ncbi:AP-2 complex subunit sigma isoform X3 [Sorex araneus]|uniref:AP-2 complex subunit sigma isoform X3 n=1 Tax=Sorex araneus TaxID=42254 RepID=UPI002433DB92|nr:AP-2 complex subunit sigma isoform X3 [Sorex araneus]